MEEVRNRTGIDLSPDVLTIGFARRATPYKRADLLFRDMQRLAEIGGGKLQIVYAGKAHPKDGGGKELIHNIFDSAKGPGRPDSRGLSAKLRNGSGFETGGGR